METGVLQYTKTAADMHYRNDGNVSIVDEKVVQSLICYVLLNI